MGKLISQETGKRVGVLLRARNVSVGEAARVAGISRATLARRLNGSTDFRAGELDALATLLDTSADALLGRSTNDDEES